MRCTRMGLRLATLAIGLLGTPLGIKPCQEALGFDPAALNQLRVTNTAPAGADLRGADLHQASLRQV